MIKVSFGVALKVSLEYKSKALATRSRDVIGVLFKFFLGLRSMVSVCSVI